ncbi:hypothetical protein HY745_10320 [Candidatus Desantisbacteria bacterium]|nr:hypothetical protein [Candidatus Desantisbacteria bacterium]MBI4846323.1 hypothetical protein [Candidatus Omnitrophota bacterium]
MKLKKYIAHFALVCCLLCIITSSGCTSLIWSGKPFQPFQPKIAEDEICILTYNIIQLCITIDGKKGISGNKIGLPSGKHTIGVFYRDRNLNYQSEQAVTLDFYGVAKHVYALSHSVDYNSKKIYYSIKDITGNKFSTAYIEPKSWKKQ